MSPRVFFTATTPATGRELWVTDGTEAGTRMVADINPGSTSGLSDWPGAMASLGDGRVVFAASDGVHGRELWVSDGTGDGTHLLADIRPGGSSHPTNMVSVGGGRVVFTAHDGVHGRELWVTDGTEAGTRLLKDINPGSASAFMPRTIDFNEAQALGDGRAVFIADDGQRGRELWVTDGTTAGTRIVADIQPGSEGSIGRFPDFYDDDRWGDQPADFFFDIGPGRAVFFADDGSRGRDLWVTDGTAAGTQMLVDHATVLPDSWMGEGWSVDYIRGVGPLWEPRALPDGRLIYNAVYSPEEGPNRSTDIATDGTPGGTVRLGQTPHAPKPAPAPVTFELEPDQGIYPLRAGTLGHQLGDGRLLYGAVTEYRTTETDAQGNPIIVTHRLGTEPWVTDGTHEGTTFLGDIFPGIGSSSPIFHALPDGRALMVARDAFEAGQGRDNVYVTDGTVAGTQMLAEGVRAFDVVPFPDGTVMFTAAGDGLWFTDGTPEGTLPGPGADIDLILPDRFLQVAPGQWLFEGWNNDRQTEEIWVTDGSAMGTGRVTDAVRLSTLDQPDFTPLGDGRVLVRRFDAEIGAEPWVFDVTAGTFEPLADLSPGTASSNPARFVVAIPAVAEVDVFDEWISMPDEPVELVLDDHFPDPAGGGLNYTVAGLPEGLAFDAATASILGSATGAPDIHEVRITAVDVTGEAVATRFDWVVPDTGMLRVASETGWYRPEPDGPIHSLAGDVAIGHRDGAAPLLRVAEGGASLDAGRLAVEGLIWPMLTQTDAPLMVGSFTLDVDNLTQPFFSDTGDADSLTLAGGLVSMTFSRLGIRPDEVAFAADLAFAPPFDDLDTAGAPLSLIVDATGLSFGPALVGTGRWYTEGVTFDLSGSSSMKLKFQNIGLFYDMVGDSLYLNGKPTLTWGGSAADEFSFIAPGPGHTLVLDLAGDTPGDVSYALGDKYIRLGFGRDDWDWDVVGTLNYAGSSGPLMPGWPELKRMSIDLNTPFSHVGGGFVAVLPEYFHEVELEAHVGAYWDPFQFNSFTFGLDGLNKPLGKTGLFVQGGKLAAEELAGRDPEEGPSYSAEMTVTLGPTPTPLRGTLSGILEPGAVEVELALASKVGDLLPPAIKRFVDPLARWFGIEESAVLDFELGRLAGTVAMDVLQPSVSGQVQASLLNGVVTGHGRYDLFVGPRDYLTHVVTQSGMIAFPEALPLIGGQGRGGQAIWYTVADDRPDTNYVAVWTSVDLPLPVSDGSFDIGLRMWEDGRVELLGTIEHPEVGSWILDPEQEVVILSARWEVPADDVALQLVTPGGTVLTEADIAARDDMAIVTALDSPTARHVALNRPEAGLWDLTVADPAGLGTVVTEASEVLPTPVTTIEAVTLDPETLEAEIRLAAGTLAAAPVTLFAADTPGAPAGRSLVELGPLEPGTLPVVPVSLLGLEPGDWWLHTRTDADGHAPGVHVFDTPLALQGAADLGLRLREGMDEASGQRTVTVEVANRGERPSGETVLHVSVPETMLGSSGPAGFQPFTAPETAHSLTSLAPGATATLGFALPAELELPAAALTLRVESAAWDANPADTLLTHFLRLSLGKVGGRLLARDGSPMAEMALTLRLPDGTEHAGVADAAGRFLFDVDDPAGGVFAGPEWSAATGPAIRTGSALEALRMAVGLQPSWGPATAEDFIAADFNGDGRLTTGDALQILRVAVGLGAEHAPRWAFYESGQDFGAVDRTAVPTDIGPDLAAIPDPSDLDLTALLVGQVQAWT